MVIFNSYVKLPEGIYIYYISHDYSSSKSWSFPPSRPDPLDPGWRLPVKTKGSPGIKKPTILTYDFKMVILFTYYSPTITSVGWASKNRKGSVSSSHWSYWYRGGDRCAVPIRHWVTTGRRRFLLPKKEPTKNPRNWCYSWNV